MPEIRLQACCTQIKVSREIKKLSKSISKDKIRKLIKQDPEPSHVPMTRRTKYFLDEWVKLTNSQKTPNIVRGYKPQFLAEPFQSFQPKTFVRNQQEAKIIQTEINTLLEKEAIEPIPHNQEKSASNFFLVKKKSGGFRPVINLKNLNQLIHTEYLTMETITNLRTMLSKDGWIVTTDISDAYLTIPLDEEFKDYVAFQYQDQTYRFLCMPFGLNDAARAFTKTMKHPAAKVRALGFKILVHLDDRILAARTRLLCLKQPQFFVNFLQKLGFRINFEKSSLAPSQIKDWLLGFVINSRSMTISLPQRKIDILIGKVRDLKNKMRVSLREISQFLGLCNSSNLTGSSALSFSSEAINSKFKALPKSLSVRLLNCSYSGHSINSRSGMVDSENEVQLVKKNLYSPAKCSHFYRLQRFRMGCPSKSGQNSKAMERKSAGLAHQYKGANGGFSCSTAVSSQLPERSHTTAFRQYNRCCLLKSSRGDKITPAFSPSHRDVVLVLGKEHLFVSSPHTRVKKFVCRPCLVF